MGSASVPARVTCIVAPVQTPRSPQATVRSNAKPARSVRQLNLRLCCALIITDGHYCAEYTSGTMPLTPCSGETGNMCCGLGSTVEDCCSSGEAFTWGDNFAEPLNSTGLQPSSSSSVIPAATSAQTAAALGNTSCPTSSSTAVSSASCPESSIVPIGLGVGLGVPLAIALATIAALIMMRKARASPSVAQRDYEHASPSWQPQYAAVPQEMQGKGRRSEQLWSCTITRCRRRCLRFLT